jgi:Uma2 family endonuclease
MYMMAGGTADHSLIGVNLPWAARNALEGWRCFVYSSDLRVLVTATGLYTYPDLSIVRGEPVFEDERRDTPTNPVVIFEVLSKSTEAYDRGEKFALYSGIESMKEYVLVSLARPRVERFVRQANGHWLYSSIAGMDGVLRLESLDCEIALAGIYNLVEFAGEESVAPSS